MKYEDCVTSDDAAKTKGNERFLVFGVQGNENATIPEDDRISLATRCPVYRTRFLL